MYQWLCGWKFSSVDEFHPHGCGYPYNRCFILSTWISTSMLDVYICGGHGYPYKCNLFKKKVYVTFVENVYIGVLLGADFKFEVKNHFRECSSQGEWFFQLEFYFHRECIFEFSFWLQIWNQHQKEPFMIYI
jgi:hypothetical protein